MTIDTSIPRSRRALLAGGLGGAAALVASALGRPLPARAGSDGDVVLGATNLATSATILRNTTNDDRVFMCYGKAGDAIWAQTDGAGANGVYATSQAGAAIVAYSATEDGVNCSTGASDKSGVRANSPSGHGVYGTSGSGIGVRGGSTSSFGVHGTSSTSDGVNGFSNSGNGVYGRSPVGTGVRGIATSGIALYGQATTGYALRISGRVKVDKASGVATIAATKTSITVTPGIDVTSTSLVLLTPKADIGSRRLWCTTDATNNRFTIRVSSAVTAGLKVGWLLLG